MKQLITIEEVIKKYPEKFGNIETRGKNTFCKCPFHSENTASMSINFEKDIFHCFSCGEKGDAIKLLSLCEGRNYSSVKTSLKKEAGLLPKNPLFKINDLFKNYCRCYMNNTEDGIKKREYLKKRGLDEKIIEKFDIGYCDSSKAFYNAINEYGVSEITMSDSGLFNRSNNLFFANRIIIPVKNIDGEVVSFVGRCLDDNVCKYLNGIETNVYKKRMNLFNIDNAKGDTVYLVEGVFDVFAFEALGLWAVASLGTALTKEQVELLKKVGVKNVIVAYDGDKAGIKAASKAKKILEEERMNTKYIYFPQGMDPNELYNKDKKRFEKILNRKLSFSDYYLCIWSSKSADEIDENVQKRSFDFVESLSDLKNVLSFWSKKYGVEKEIVYDIYKKHRLKNISKEKLEDIVIAYALSDKYDKIVVTLSILSDKINEKLKVIKKMSTLEKENMKEKTKKLKIISFEDALAQFIKLSL